MNKNLIGVFDAVNEAWTLVKKNLNLFLYIGIGLQLLSAVVNWLLLGKVVTDVDTLNSGNLVSLIPSFSLSFLFAIVLGSLISLSLALLVIKTSRGETVTINSLINDVLKVYFKFLAVEFIVGAIVVVGFILLIIPGIIFSAWFFAAIFILLEQNTDVFEAIKQSKNLVAGLTAEVLLRFALGALLLICASIIFGILVSFPISVVGKGPLKNLLDSVVEAIFNGATSVMSVAFTYVIYRSLKNLKSSSPAETAPEQPAPEAPTPAT